MRIFTTGIEEVSANADFVPMMWDAVGTGVSVDSTIFHGYAGGTKSALFADNGTGQTASRSFNTTKTSGTIWTRQYVYFDTFGTAPNSFGSLVVLDNAGTAIITVKFNPSTQTFELVNAAPATPVTTVGSVAISSAHWYRIEVQVVIASTATGSATVNIYDGDSTTVLDSMTQTSVQTLPASGSYSGYKVGNWTPVAWGPLHVDDIAINDETTAANDNQTSWCGPGVIVTLVPNSDVSVTWTKGGTSPASTNYGGVDELPADDGVDFNGTTGNTNIDQFGITQLPSGAPTSGYNCVDVYSRFGGISTSAGTIQYALWLQGSRSEGPTPGITVALNGWKRGTTDQHFCHDLSTYSKTDVNGMNLGYSASSGSSVTKRVTAIWASVDYVPAVATVNVSQSAGTPLMALTDPSASKVTNYIALTDPSSAKSSWVQAIGTAMSPNRSTPYEAKGIIIAAGTAVSAYEALLRVYRNSDFSAAIGGFGQFFGYFGDIKNI